MNNQPFKDCKIFIDCGAPSLYNKLSRGVEKKGLMGSLFSERKHDTFDYTESPAYIKYRADYIDFVKKHDSDIYIYSNLDVINNPKLTYTNQRILEDAGLKPIPVYHLGSDEKYLKKYMENYEYIALGGLVPNPTRVLIPMLDTLFKKYLITDQGLPRVKLHGFACTSMPLMQRYPWYSVDSATCRKMAAYGGIVIPTANSTELAIQTISIRDAKLEYRITPGILNQLKKKCKEYHFTIEELTTKAGARTTWNFLMFLEVLHKTVPAWPWNFHTKKSITDAEHFLDFYFAGAMAKSEEEFFWKRLLECGTMSQDKRRLLTFFYKEQFTTLNGLKHS